MEGDFRKFKSIQSYQKFRRSDAIGNTRESCTTLCIDA